MSERCGHCGRALSLVPDDDIRRERVSHGFGAANKEMLSYCGARCRALDNDRDAVLETTQQMRLAAWSASGLERGADAIVWSV